PLPRAIRRQEFLQAWGPDKIRQMEKAARELRSTPFAALDLDLIEQLTSWSYRSELRPKIRRQREKAAAAARRTLQPRRGVLSDFKGTGWSAALMIFIAINLVRICAGGFSTRPAYNAPSYTPPTQSLFKFDAEQWRRSLDK